MKRPKVADVIAWMGATSDSTDGDGSPLDLVTAVAVSTIEQRCNLDRFPEGSLEPDADNYPDVVRAAILITAARLYKRRTTPQGVSDFGELGVIQVGSIDSDVENLIAPYVKLQGFA